MAKQKVKKADEINIGNDYDAFPYESYPFAHTNPVLLFTLAKLFGVEAPPVEKARILELGCAAGSNIMKLAEIYPSAKFVGIDISKVEIDHGKEDIKKLGLKNIELKDMSITDIDESFGEFDYIIAHGIFSWIPEEVREALLSVCQKNLSKNGLAYVSYNTLPGWNMVNIIRDMMMFHSGGFQEDKEKVNQARLLLNFVNEALEGSDTPYSRFLKSEADNLSKQSDSYLRHDHLSSENKQFYFYEFINLAKKHGLNYLSDVSLNTMFVGNLPPKAATKLAEIKDLVRTEQYIDFLLNRRFRCTVLCKEDVKINRNLSPKDFNDLYLSLTFLEPSVPLAEIDFKDNTTNIAFYLSPNKDSSVSTLSPIMKAAFCVYGENIGNPLNASELAKKIQEKASQFTLDQISAEIDLNLGRLVLGNYFRIFAKKPKTIFKISDKPKVSDLVIFQAKKHSPNFWVTNETNELITLPIHEKELISMLDGKTTLAELKEKMADKFFDGTVNAHENNFKITDRDRLKEIASTVTEQALEKFKSSYLLIG